jgi:hypothetical protein
VATRSLKRGTIWRIDLKKTGDFRQKIWAVSFAQKQGLAPTPCHLLMLKTPRFPTLTFVVMWGQTWVPFHTWSIFP